MQIFAFSRGENRTSQNLPSIILKLNHTADQHCIYSFCAYDDGADVRIQKPQVTF